MLSHVWPSWNRGTAWVFLLGSLDILISGLVRKPTVAAGDRNAGAGAGDWKCIAIYIADVDVWNIIRCYK